MKQTNNIPTDYKLSSLGIIPQDWEVKRVKDFGKVITGNTPATSNLDNYGDEFMFVSPADLGINKYIKSTEKMLSIKGFSFSRVMPKGTVLFTCIGSTIGKSGIANEDLTSNQQINAIICNKQSNNEFLYYELSFKANKIKILAGEQAVPIINKSDFENIKIAFPPLPEQKKIAKILGIWDIAIEKQTTLIEKLEIRKRSLMQQLLTCKGESHSPLKRLKGFSGKWGMERLEDIAEIKKGTQVNKIELSTEGKYPTINGGIEPSGWSDYFNTEENTITISEGGNSCGFVNLIKSKFWSGGHCYTIHEKSKIIKMFLFFILKYKELEIMNLRVGSGLPNIQSKPLLNFRISIPSIEEQTAIATILTTADHEITLAKQKLASLQQQKKGLMQVLLTGKKRVKI